jgi:alpha-tubulin suppressor-like RCC1 family protein
MKLLAIAAALALVSLSTGAADAVPATGSITSAAAHPRSEVGWQSITTGFGHTCGIRSDATLWCWGLNAWGQLGDGTKTNHLVPTQVGDRTDWMSVSAGTHFTCATRLDHTLWCWGFNGDGELGTGDMRDRLQPTRVGESADWASVGAGVFHACGVRLDGTVWCWGDKVHHADDGQLRKRDPLEPTQIGSATTWVNSSASYAHTCATQLDGTLWCWGPNKGKGGLGGARTSKRHKPAQVDAGTDWTLASAGDFFTCATKTDGSGWCWGDNNHGQLGDDTTRNKRDPGQIGSDLDWALIDAGGAHSCGRRLDGTAWCWGWNGFGQLGIGSFSDEHHPVQVGSDTDWLTLSTGEEHSCGIRANGSAWCWGSNSYGELGNDSKTSSPTPKKVQG